MRKRGEGEKGEATSRDDGDERINSTDTGLSVLASTTITTSSENRKRAKRGKEGDRGEGKKKREISVKGEGVAI